MLINNLFCWSKSQRWRKKASMSVFMLATLFFHTPAAAVFDTTFPNVQHRFDIIGGGEDYGLSGVLNMNELLLWGDEFYKSNQRLSQDKRYIDEEIGILRKNRMVDVLAQRESVKKILDICYAGTRTSLIPGLSGAEEKGYSPKDVLLENTDNGQKFVRTLMSMHICFGYCKGKVDQILKMFLGRGNLEFIKGTTVQDARDELTLNEQYYIMLIRQSFLQHIAKHWIYGTDRVDLNVYNAAQHNEKSGFVSFPSRVDDFPRAEEYAVDVLLSNPELLGNLKILKTNGGDLTISTVDGLKAGLDATMFEMTTTLFQKRVQNHTKTRSFALSHKVADGVFKDEECLNPATWKKNTSNLRIGRIAICAQSGSRFKCFFKLTLPNNICFTTLVPIVIDFTPVPLGAGVVSNRVDNMGSFYAKAIYFPTITGK